MTLIMQLADFASRLLQLYSFLIWIRIIMSWFVRYPRQGSFSYYLNVIVDPYLNLFRSKNARIGMLDFSPVFAIGVISVVASLLKVFSIYGYLTLGIILAYVVQGLWNYAIAVYLWIVIFQLIMKLISAFTGNSRLNYAFTEPSPIEKLVRGCFSKTIPRDTTVYIITLVINIALYFICKRLFSVIAWYALQLPV